MNPASILLATAFVTTIIVSFSSFCVIVAQTVREARIERRASAEDKFLDAFRNLLSVTGKLWLANGLSVTIRKRSLDGVVDLFRNTRFGIVYADGEIYVIYAKEVTDYLKKNDQNVLDE